MSAEAALAAARALHEPVMLAEVLSLFKDLKGVIVDGTFGAGGYTTALLDAGAEKVIALDRDPEAVARGREWAPAFGDRLEIIQCCFGDLDEVIEEPVAGVVLDIGVSSMQIDEGRRGFSFQKEGPLDMRMGGDGPDAADLVNEAAESELADIFFHYGEERAARHLAKMIVRARAEEPITGTLALASLIEKNSPRPKPGRPHAATRVFQALRIAVNDELGELTRALSAAELRLQPGGVLGVVTFHSLEDRIVKRFLRNRGGAAPGGSRHAPEAIGDAPGFEIITRKPMEPSEAELERNLRARSARLRAARRTEAPAKPVSPRVLGLPELAMAGRG